jgi:hypothetical protein
VLPLSLLNTKLCCNGYIMFVVHVKMMNSLNHCASGYLDLGCLGYESNRT